MVAGARRLAPDRVTALVPCHLAPPDPALLLALVATVGGVLVIDDGMPRHAAAELRDLARRYGAAVLRLGRNRGKGHALAAGLERLGSLARPPQGVLMVDGDGQHPPAAVPRFLAAAAEADLVVGDRFGDLRRMPLERRVANLGAAILVATATGQRVRDTQCGMRLLRGRALHEVRFRPGGYEAETRHLVECLRAGVRVSWVPIPAIYGDEASSFRRFRDSARVAAASLSGARRGATGRGGPAAASARRRAAAARGARSPA